MTVIGTGVNHAPYKFSKYSNGSQGANAYHNEFTYLQDKPHSVYSTMYGSSPLANSYQPAQMLSDQYKAELSNTLGYALEEMKLKYNKTDPKSIISNGISNECFMEGKQSEGSNRLFKEIARLNDNDTLELSEMGVLTRFKDGIYQFVSKGFSPRLANKLLKEAQQSIQNKKLYRGKIHKTYELDGVISALESKMITGFLDYLGDLSFTHIPFSHLFSKDRYEKTQSIMQQIYAELPFEQESEKFVTHETRLAIAA